MADYKKNHDVSCQCSLCYCDTAAQPGVRSFESGATRSPISGKLQYEGFFSPLVLRRRAQYMHKHRFQSDGNVRAADNWQKGMPLDVYIDSGMRHFMDWWLHHRELSEVAEEPIEDALCALMFNVEGYLYEILKCKKELKKELVQLWPGGLPIHHSAVGLKP